MPLSPPHCPPALLLIDMQQGIQGVTRERNNPQAETRSAELLAQWRQAGWPLVHIRHISRQAGSVFAPGQSGVLFQPPLAPRPDEPVFDKNVTDALALTGLEPWLHARGIRELVLVGVASENSVEATARSASCRGFAVRVVSDACYTFAKLDYAGQPRSAEEVHDMAMANLRDEYAQVVHSAALRAALFGSPDSDRLEWRPTPDFDLQP